jgi:NAD(P)-dependent dehydrogenase (short-subunit alcohol dehydrogenase family)
LVTGGAAGLGHALCRQLQAEGWRIVTCDIVKPDDPDWRWIELDLGDRAALDERIPTILALGPYELVVLNAGISATGRFEHLPVEAMLRVLRVNAETPMVLTSRLESARCLAAGATIVFVSSLSHFTGYPGAAAYSAAKDTLAVYARGICRRMRKNGVHVLTVFPGPIRTPHAERHAPSGAKADRRMPAQQMAKAILEAVGYRRRTLLPGAAAKLTAAFGRVAPAAMTAVMRWLIYRKLDRETW